MSAATLTDDSLVMYKHILANSHGSRNRRSVAQKNTVRFALPTSDLGKEVTDNGSVSMNRRGTTSQGTHDEFKEVLSK